MLKAGALYFAIVIAFFIAIVSASLLMLGAHYRNAYLKELRYARLLNNLNSGVEMVLASQYKFEDTKAIDLYADQSDSIEVTYTQWGVFDLALVKAFILNDTLKRSMLIGTTTDSTVVYLSDEDRPLALNGRTKIVGNAYLPKSGVKKTYVEGKPYLNEELVYGDILHSTRKLKTVDTMMLSALQHKLIQQNRALPKLQETVTEQSFYAPTLAFNLAPKARLENRRLKGNIVLYADSSITVAASAQLDGVQLFAPVIKIEEGFEGNCQLFATDSVLIGKKAKLRYPSVAAVISTEKLAGLPQLILQEDVLFEGILFSYEQKRSPLQTMVGLGKGVKVKGEIYATGFLKLGENAVVNGKVSCNRLWMDKAGVLYENLLIDVVLDRKARSPYYLSSRLFKEAQQHRVLKWLD